MEQNKKFDKKRFDELAEEMINLIPVPKIEEIDKEEFYELKRKKLDELKGVNFDELEEELISSIPVPKVEKIDKNELYRDVATKAKEAVTEIRTDIESGKIEMSEEAEKELEEHLAKLDEWADDILKDDE